MNWTINLETVIKIMAAIATVYGGAVILAKPIKGVVDTIGKHDKEIRDLQKAVEENSKDNKTIMSALMAMVNHMIDGNGIEGLKKVRDDLQKDLIEK
jgi:hypothetical protein